MAAKKAKKAAKKSTKKTVKLTIKRAELERLVDAAASIGAPGFCLEKFVDDKKTAKEMKERAKKARQGS